MKKLTFAAFMLLLLTARLYAQEQGHQLRVSREAGTRAVLARSASARAAAEAMHAAHLTAPVPPAPPAAPVQPSGPAVVFMQSDPSDDPVLRKVFSKSFSVDRSNRVVINNQFGEVQIKSWDKMEVRAEVEIKAYATETEDARRLLDGVTIQASQNGNVVTYRTNIDDNRGKWGSWFSGGKRGRREVRVNYVVYLPTVNSLNVTNQYGNVEMGNFSGPLTANVQYGNFNAVKLTNSAVSISTQYGKTTVEALNRANIRHEYGAGITIGAASGLNLHAQYAKVTIGSVANDALIRQEYGEGLTLGTVGSLDLSAQYVRVNIREIKSANPSIRLDYGSLLLGNVRSLSLDADYTDVNISNLRGDGRFSVTYNKLSIGQVGAGVRSLVVNGQYADISLGFVDDFNGDFDVQTNYSNLRYGGNNRISARSIADDNHTSRRYQGKIGSGGSVVKINSDYGGVTFR
ncbi:DUF4097 family beta strand repeat-containing protein [Pedobacter sp. SYP-B3415]|uniref:DUF4097 family beta strand repeat-containing protein n=1 Tax=Pedobacter sp. SYP-B3415 TaxID=2496641 RepID=UPI00101BA856|nr:DUF4097 family beta strand repeat-containing protein [Pedobacter sp. SYP-B3415]